MVERAAERRLSYRYGRGWNEWSKQPVDEIDEGQARERFASGPWFSVSALEEGARVPRYTLEIGVGGRFVRVETYLPSGSVRAIHDYEGRLDPSGEWMFLEGAEFYRYPDDEHAYGLNKLVAKLEYRWRPDGYARVGAFDRAQGRREEVTEYTDVPVADQWVPALKEFGDWDRFETPPTVPEDA